MNISSAIVLIQERMQEVLDEIDAIEGCEVHLYDEQKHLAIISIEAKNVSKEMEILQKVQGIDGVIEANLHYSYSEEELNQARKNLSDAYLETLDSADIESVRYSGSIYHQMHSSDEQDNN